MIHRFLTHLLSLNPPPRPRIKELTRAKLRAARVAVLDVLGSLASASQYLEEKKADSAASVAVECSVRGEDGCIDDAWEEGGGTTPRAAARL